VDWADAATDLPWLDIVVKHFPLALAGTRRRRAMLQFLLIDCAVFLTLFLGYLFLRIRSPEWSGALHFASAIMAIAMSLFTFAGSFTMAAAQDASGKGDEVLASRLISATVGLWVTFLICEAMEWGRLLLFEKPPAIFAQTFCLLTGYHALHLIAGLPYLIMVVVNLKKSDVGAAALFTHFTNLVWLMIFVAFYLFGTDLQGL